MAPDTQSRLDREIQLLRERLEGAEEMRRAVIAEELDGFVVGDGDHAQRVVLLETSTLATRPLLETLPHSAVTVSTTGDILYANQRFADRIGRSLASLFSASMPQLLTAECRAEFTHWLASARADASLDIELVHHAGRRVAARVTIVGIGNGHVSLVVADRGEDADEAQEALRAIHDGDIDGVVVGGEEVMLLNHARNAYRALVDRMQQGAVTLAGDGTILYANARFADMVGRARESMLGMRVGEVLGTAALDDVVRQRGRSVPSEISIAHADGGALRVGVTAEPVENVEAVTLVLSDLTERDRHLQMQERAQRNDRFLAVLAHELRNPLGAVRNAVEILRRSGVAQNGARFALDVIERQSETLVRLVDDLLDVHRLNEDKIVLRPQPVDLREVIERAVAAARPAFEAKQQVITVRAPDDAPLYANADVVRLAQVLGNLLVNACKFTPAGGRVEVVLERANAAGGDARASIRIVDSGVGVPPALLDTLFDPYVQAPHDDQEFPEGLGLGLSVARRLVQLHGGSIAAHSAGLGHGTTLHIELPTCAAPAALPSQPAPDVASGRRLRILIADDDEDSASSLAHLLSERGHATRTAHGGAEALAVAEAFQPDVVILDIGMPEVDGWKVGRALRARPWATRLVVYALTGWSQPQAIERTRDAGFDRHFAKPLAFDELLRDLHARTAALKR